MSFEQRNVIRTERTASLGLVATGVIAATLAYLALHNGEPSDGAHGRRFN